MSDSIGGAAAIAAQAPAQFASAITAAADAAFIDALGRTTIVAAVVALAGAVVALIWLPARADVARARPRHRGGRRARAGRRRGPVDAGRRRGRPGHAAAAGRRGDVLAVVRGDLRPLRRPHRDAGTALDLEGRRRRGRARGALRPARHPRHREPPSGPRPVPRRPGRAPRPSRRPSRDRHPHQGERRRTPRSARSCGPASSARAWTASQARFAAAQVGGRHPGRTPTWPRPPSSSRAACSTGPSSGPRATASSRSSACSEPARTDSSSAAGGSRSSPDKTRRVPRA